MLTAQPDQVAEVVERDGSIKLGNRYWTLTIGTSLWLDPSYLYDNVRQVPVADEKYA